ncbi:MULTISPECIES: bifunctional 2-polyprenyl-6-hydroxyphenol methylase/3-demethylubiquinol 3-O-methyltransferase UbiG [unclassified Bradyrhizobium]|uniref:class I SAM-dependent methyltransferase n=1 Tax=unclassified Bradyrhizobium TaxID=2631580 RepID=UPI001BA9B29D|nr:MULTISPECIES: class I SAM-dependent methyltransferase [unclassified Bradyrhizobium]MBR1227416.1 class I SAM-dependent methyltransferase [Bradyrhizobium sp. AUGA SZCCT0176]MBR1299140.1 class I SAM-dependent methyltransferase [Bradyrhizobium sp. AUGA SZCCT0042]
MQPKTVVDIGCGVGFHDREMANYPFVDSVDAIDPSAASVEKANEHYPHPKVTRWVSGFDELSSSKNMERCSFVVSRWMGVFTLRVAGIDPAG